MHGSHRVHGELIDRYKTNEHTRQLFSAFLPDSMGSNSFVSTSLAISGDDELPGRVSFVSNSVNLFLFSVPTVRWFLFSSWKFDMRLTRSVVRATTPGYD